MPTKKWTEEEEEFLKENFMNMTNAELAEKFDITKNAVQKKLARMDLKRSEAAKQEPIDESTDTEPSEEEEIEVASTESHFFVGSKLFYEDRNYEKAIEEYRRAAQEESDELIRVKARYWMAECYVKMQDIEKATEAFKDIAEEYEGHYLAESARRRFQALKDHIVPAM